MRTKIGEYRSKKFYNLGAKVVDVEILLDKLSRVKGRNENDTKNLEVARRYAMKVSAHALSDVVSELNSEHLEQLRLDPEWQKAEAESIRKVMDEFEERKDAEWQKASDEADETVQ